jgi:hypothetical protein
MFVSDTSRLPDSGRVCVVDSTATPSGGTFYNVLINAARAEVEPMSEPRNPAHVLGKGARVPSLKGPVFAAYFAGSRDRFEAEPNYKDGLFVLVDGAVYGVRQENVATSISRGMGKRTFTLLRGDRPQRSVEYAWPLHRQLSNSGDFLHELAQMVRDYGSVA